MLYTFVSKDTTQVLKSAKRAIAQLLEKEPYAVKMELDARAFAETEPEVLLFSQALFKSKYIVLLDNIFELKNNKDKFFSNIDGIANTHNIFFLIADQVTKTEEKILAEKSSKYVNKSSNQPKQNNNFALVDFMYALDIPKLWNAYLRAVTTDDIQSIYGMLWWGIKNIKISKICNISESGLKPYVYNKAKNSYMGKMTHFEQTVNEFEKLPLVGAQKNIPLRLLLEKWILTLKVNNK